MASSSYASINSLNGATLLEQALSDGSQHARLLRLHTPLGPDNLLVEQLKGQQDLQGGDVFILTVLATDNHIALTDVLGQAVLVELLTAHSRTELRPFHGHVTRAMHVGANGGMVRYQLRIEPWLAYLRYRVDSTLYQDMTVMEILDSVFRDYQAGSGLPNGKLNPRWRYALADERVYPKRSLTTQYQESDWAFVQRLMHEEGLFCWWEYQSDMHSDAFGTHTLVIADHNGAFTENAQSQVPFKQMRAVINEDSIDRWQHQVKGVPTQVSLQSWDYRQCSSRPVIAEAPVAPTASDLPPELAAPYYTLPPMAIHDTLGAYAYETTEQGQRLATRRLQSLLAASQQFIGAGSVRTFSPGSTFTLTGHATDMQHSPLVITKVVHLAHNNLSADLQLEIARHLGLQPATLEQESTRSAANRLLAFGDSQQQAGERPLYRNRIECIPLSTPWRNPHGDQHHTVFYPKPTVTGQQTAIVVGPEGQVIHTDRDHRVQIQFHWQRASAPSHRSQNKLMHPSAEGHTGAPADHHSGTWVRVMTSLAPIAGQNWGSVAIPRIGQEVLVDFIEGDIDRPVIIGTLYNGQGRENARGNHIAYGAGKSTGNAPAWFPGSEGAHAHAAVFSGIKTQSLETSQTGNGAYNQLVFDDTPQQGRINLQQYKHTQSISQLNLGHLYYQQDNQRLHPTGFGTELATHHALAIRAGSGLLISTDNRVDANTSQLDSREAQTISEQTLALQRTLANNAEEHRITLNVAKQNNNANDTHNSIAAHQTILDSLNSQAIGHRADNQQQERVTAYSQTNIHFSSPAGIISSTSKSIIVSAGGTTGLTAMHDISFATKGQSSHIAEKGIRFFTHGKFDAQANPNKPVNETGIRMHAANGRVEVHSQSGQLHVHAEKNVNVTSVSNSIHMRSPKRIQFICAGASLKLDGSNIEIVAPAGFTMMAARKVLKGPKAETTKTEKMPTLVTKALTPNKHSVKVDLSDWIGAHPDTHTTVSRVPFKVKQKDGTTILTGLTDTAGLTPTLFTETEEELDIFVGDGAWHYSIDALHANIEAEESEVHDG